MGTSRVLSSPVIRFAEHCEIIFYGGGSVHTKKSKRKSKSIPSDTERKAQVSLQCRCQLLVWSNKSKFHL